jgi:hypothetical protein
MPTLPASSVTTEKNSLLTRRHLSTLFAVGAAETVAGLELVVALTGEGGEAALRVDGVGEELVGPTVVAQVVVGVVGAVVS